MEQHPRKRRVTSTESVPSVVVEIFGSWLPSQVIPAPSAPTSKVSLLHGEASTAEEPDSGSESDPVSKSDPESISGDPSAPLSEYVGR